MWEVKRQGDEAKHSTPPRVCVSKWSPVIVAVNVLTIENMFLKR
jgi:hypothetical protein